MLLVLAGGGSTAFIYSRSGSVPLERFLERHSLLPIRIRDLGQGRRLAEVRRNSRARRAIGRLPRVTWRELWLEILTLVRRSV